MAWLEAEPVERCLCVWRLTPPGDAVVWVAHVEASHTLLRTERQSTPVAALEALDDWASQQLK